MLKEKAGTELQFGLMRKLWKWKVNILNTTESYITDCASGNFDVKLFYQRERERKKGCGQSGSQVGGPSPPSGTGGKSSEDPH